jgi:hypothetical protein
MRDYLFEAGDVGRYQGIEQTYLFTTSFRTQEIIPRLTLNKRDHDFFKKRILSRPDSPEGNVQPDKNRDSHFRIIEAAEIAKARIKQIVDPFDPQKRADKLADWLDYPKERARVIWISVSDDANAYTIFETLNDRGADLSTADLLKVNLFNVAGKRIDEAESRWDAMLGTLESMVT